MSGEDDDDFAARVGAGAPGSGAGGWDDDDEAPEFSDEDLALRFAALHVYTMRYVAKWGRWFKWTGKVWEADEKRVAFSLSRQVSRAAARECQKGREVDRQREDRGGGRAARASRSETGDDG